MAALILLRHGPAADRDPRRWPEDTERPLTPEGIRETEKAAKGLHRIAPDIALVASSGATRALRTAEIARRALGLRSPVDVWDELAPDASAAPVLARAAELATKGRVPLLVGHEPTLGELVGYALTGDEISLVRLGRAGAVQVAFDRSVAPGGGRIEWMLDRKNLARLRS